MTVTLVSYRACMSLPQLMALQTSIFPAVQAYYQHRNQSVTQELTRIVRRCSTSHTQVQELRKKFQLVVSAMHSFLESHVGAQAEIASVRTLTKKLDVISTKDLPAVHTLGSSSRELFMDISTRHHQKTGAKAVSFALPVPCS